MKRMKNLVVPTITPFEENGDIDIEATKSHYDFLLKAGVKNFYILGTTGEVFLMNKEERKKTAEIIVDFVGNKGNVFIHIGAQPTVDACELAAHAENIGAAGVGAVTPFYFKFSQIELEEYYLSIAKSVKEDFPVYLYNLPGCTTNDLLPETVSKLARVDNIIGIKNSMSDIFRLTRLVDETPEDFDVIIGSDPIILPAMLSGAKGSVSGNANVFPEVFLGLFQALEENNYEKAHQKQIAIKNIAMALKDGANLAYFKEALVHRGFKKTFTRKPILGLSQEEKDQLKVDMQRIIENYL